MCVDITQHLALVSWRVDRRWARYIGGRIKRDDLISEGHVGLMKAAARYDPARGTTFSTYAVWWVDCLIRRYIIRRTRLVPLPAAEPKRESLQALRTPELVVHLDGPVVGLDNTSRHDLLGHDDPSPERVTARKDVARLLALIRDERTRCVITAYYIGGLLMEEIGQALGISRARVQQILQQGLSVMRAGVGIYGRPVVNPKLSAAVKAAWAKRRAERDVA